MRNVPPCDPGPGPGSWGGEPWSEAEWWRGPAPPSACGCHLPIAAQQGGARSVPKHPKAVRGNRNRLRRLSPAQDTDARRIVAEILHDERAIVIGEQRNMVGRIDGHRRVGEEELLEPGDHRLRQVVEVAEILRH